MNMLIELDSVEVQYPDLTTDRERVKGAFKELRKRGYGCRANYLCCGSCAGYAMGEKHADKKGVVYYSRQGESAYGDAERYRVGWGRYTYERGDDLVGNLYLSWSGDGDEIAAVLRKHGLVVEWQGSDAYCIIVKGRTSDK